MVGGSHALSGEHPFEPKYTYHQKYYEGTWFYAEKNRAGDYFVYHQGFFHKIENPVLANPLPWGDTKPITEAANADNS